MFILDILRTWIEKYPTVIPVALYTYLRLIEDHDGQHLASLRQLEIEFCINLLREKVTIISRIIIFLLLGINLSFYSCMITV